MYYFFFNDTATTEIYTLSLHDALPICHHGAAGLSVTLDRLTDFERAFLTAAEAGLSGLAGSPPRLADCRLRPESVTWDLTDRKSTRLNSSHANISYAVFCLKKKKEQ